MASMNPSRNYSNGWAQPITFLGYTMTPKLRSGWSTLAISDGHPTAFGLSTSTADDYLDFSVFLSPGTYELIAVFRCGATTGKVEFFLNYVSQTVFDTTNAGGTGVRMFRRSFTVTEAKAHSVKFVNSLFESKSSSEFKGFYIRRTA